MEDDHGIAFAFELVGMIDGLIPYQQHPLAPTTTTTTTTGSEGEKPADHP